jgi:hypothetical protein
MSLRQSIRQQVYEPQNSMSDSFSRRIMHNTIGIQDPPYDFNMMRRDQPRVSRPQFRSKVVCVLDCKHCQSEVCRRGMKAILLADMNVELFSTDSPPYGVQLVNDDYRTRNCFCRIRDVACLGWYHRLM